MSQSKAKSGRVAVVGGGLGGLASACTLAARGYEVVLFDKNDWLGGKAAVLEAKGFRFDMGPTILLMPSVIAKIFAEAGRDLADELELIPLDPQWRSFFEDGSTLDLSADIKRMVAILDSFAPEGADGRGYERFLGLARRLDEISRRYFFWRSIGSARDIECRSRPSSPTPTRSAPTASCSAISRRPPGSSAVGDTSRPAPGSSSTWASTAATTTCCTTTSCSPATPTRNSTRSTVAAS